MIDRDASNRTVEIINLGFIDPLMKTSTIDDVVVMLMMRKIKVSSIRTLEDSCGWVIVMRQREFEV